EAGRSFRPATPKAAASGSSWRKRQSTIANTVKSTMPVGMGWSLTKRGSALGLKSLAAGCKSGTLADARAKGSGRIPTKEEMYRVSRPCSGPRDESGEGELVGGVSSGGGDKRTLMYTSPRGGASDPAGFLRGQVNRRATRRS